MAAQLGRVDGRAFTHVGDAIGVLTAGIDVEVQALEGVAGAERPASQQLPVGEHLEAMRIRHTSCFARPHGITW